MDSYFLTGFVDFEFEFTASENMSVRGGPGDVHAGGTRHTGQVPAARAGAPWICTLHRDLSWKQVRASNLATSYFEQQICAVCVSWFLDWSEGLIVNLERNGAK